MEEASRLGYYPNRCELASSRVSFVLEGAGINRRGVADERAGAAMLADVPVGESPTGGSAQLPP